MRREAQRSGRRFGRSVARGLRTVTRDRPGKLTAVPDAGEVCSAHFSDVRHFLAANVGTVRNLGPAVLDGPPGPLDEYPDHEPIALCLVPNGESFEGRCRGCLRRHHVRPVGSELGRRLLLAHLSIPAVGAAWQPAR